MIAYLIATMAPSRSRWRNDFCVVAMIAPYLVVERYDSES